MFIIIQKKYIYKLIILLVLITTFSWVANSKVVITNTTQKGHIALVIDDFGYNAEGTDEMLQLGIPITAAVIPFLYNSERDADRVHEAGHEVILHVPLEAQNGRNKLLGPKGITCDLSDHEIRKRVEDSLAQLKWAVGMNNHMGSKATQDKRVMENVLAVAEHHHLFFIDSRTTVNTIVIETAEKMNVPSVRRDLFLDHSKAPSDIEKQLLELADIALENGYAVGIGHVGPAGGKVTANAIKKMIPILEKKGIEFVYASQIFVQE